MRRADNPDANATLTRRPRVERSWTSWLVAALLAGALIGVQHDPNYATRKGAESIETSRGLDRKAAMEEGIGFAAATSLAGFALLVCAGFVCAVTRPRDARFQVDGLMVLVVLGLLWAVASWSWSVHRETTARELVRLFTYLGVAAALARRFDPRTLCFVLAAALAGSVGTAVSFEIATGGFRPWQADYRLTGSMHSNILAVQATVVALVAYAFATGAGRRHVAILWAVFLAAVAIVVLTKTRSAVATTFAGVIAIQLIGQPTRIILRNGIWAATLLSVLLLVIIMLDLSDTRSLEHLGMLGRTDDVSSLTGRIPLWEFVWEESADRRLQGFGYGAFWVVEQTEAAGDALNWFPRHAHNIYLETIVNLGVLGLMLLLAIGMTALRRAWQLAGRSGLAEFRALAAIVVAAGVNGLSEAAFVMPRDMLLFVAAAVFAVTVAHPQYCTALGISQAAAEPLAASTRQRTPTGKLNWSNPSPHANRWSKS